LFGILKLGHCDLPFDLAQGGELAEPFGIYVLLLEIFIAETSYETSSELRRVGHRADHIPAGTVARPTSPKFLFRLDRPFFWPAAGLTPETRHL